MFSGFGTEEGRIPIPESFFASVLPSITHLAELKVTLHVLWRLAAQVGHPRLVSEPELAADPVLTGALTAGH
ncbi:MAG: primosomal replication protein N, partial [Chloroflexota bacterium]|nr:primosomal replication protein N [Chloroflexota bacterium]